MQIETITFQRTLTPRLTQILKAGNSFILFGPRQTGKTTLLEGIFSKLLDRPSLRYYFQLPSQRESVETDPEVILREAEALRSPKPVYLFIDEIQKFPQVMDVLQFLIDQKKVVLAATGSSARKMKKLGANWLPGRIRLEHLYPLTWEETKNRVSLPEILSFGSLPGILSEKTGEQREQNLSAYAHLYLDEEIRMEALVRNVPRFTQFLRLAALESGSSPNFSKIGNQVGLSHTTIREYFQILEDTLITHRLNSFGSKRDAVLRTPKYYFFDIGVRNAAAQIGHSPGILNLQGGLLFEHFVILEAIARWKHEVNLFYWRTKKGEEVDLVLQYQNRLIPLEIKNTKKPSNRDFEGLTAFHRKYKNKVGYLVCQVDRAQKFGPFFAIPWTELKTIEENLK